MADCYKALLVNESSASVDIIYLANDFRGIHALYNNINMVAMLMRDVLLCHFRKQMFRIAVAHSVSGTGYRVRTHVSCS